GVRGGNRFFAVVRFFIVFGFFGFRGQLGRDSIVLPRQLPFELTLGAHGVRPSVGGDQRGIGRRILDGPFDIAAHSCPSCRVADPLLWVDGRGNSGAKTRTVDSNAKRCNGLTRYAAGEPPGSTRMVARRRRSFYTTILRSPTKRSGENLSRFRCLRGSISYGR